VADQTHHESRYDRIRRHLSAESQKKDVRGAGCTTGRSSTVKRQHTGQEQMAGILLRDVAVIKWELNMRQGIDIAPPGREKYRNRQQNPPERFPGFEG
jgi:hypothetical protein